jgi:hypothetical protein
MSLTITIDEEERQLMLLALACLAVQRPGFDYALSTLALKMDNARPDGRPEMFDEFKTYNTPPPRPKPTAAIAHFRLFPNLAVTVFDQNFRQIPELQIGLLPLWAEHAERMGHNPEGVVVEVESHIGFPKFRIFRTEAGWNWEPWRGP